MVPGSVRREQVVGPGEFLLFDKMYRFARRHPTRWAKTLLLVASIGVHGCLDFRAARVAESTFRRDDPGHLKLEVVGDTNHAVYQTCHCLLATR
jgi:hypothetical protein